MSNTRNKGIIVPVYSPYHGQGTSACVMALSRALTAKGNKKVLTTQTHFADWNNIELPLLGDNVTSLAAANSFGLDALIADIDAAMYDGETLMDSTFDLGNNHFFLPGLKAKNKDTYAHQLNKVGLAISEISKMYDYTIVDMNSGGLDTNIQTINSELIYVADTVIICLRQERDKFEVFTNETALLPCFKNKKLFYVIVDYDADQKYNLAELRRENEIPKKNIGVIRHCSAYADAINEHKVIAFLDSQAYLSPFAKDHKFFMDLNVCATNLESLILAQQNVPQKEDDAVVKSELSARRAALQKYSKIYGWSSDKEWL